MQSGGSAALLGVSRQVSAGIKTHQGWANACPAWPGPAQCFSGPFFLHSEPLGCDTNPLGGTSQGPALISRARVLPNAGCELFLSFPTSANNNNNKKKSPSSLVPQSATRPPVSPSHAVPSRISSLVSEPPKRPKFCPQLGINGEEKEKVCAGKVEVGKGVLIPVWAPLVNFFGRGMSDSAMQDSGTSCSTSRCSPGHCGDPGQLPGLQVSRARSSLWLQPNFPAP